MNTAILIVIIVILVCMAILAFLLFRRRSSKWRYDDMNRPRMVRSSRGRQVIDARIGDMYRPRMVGSKSGKVTKGEKVTKGRTIDRQIHVQRDITAYREILQVQDDLAIEEYCAIEEDLTEEDLIKERQAAEAELKARRESFRKKYRISIAHPKLLSKRYSSRFLVQLYLPEMRSKVSRTLAREFGKQEIAELVRDSELETGQRIQIRLSSPDIVFSDPIIKKLDKAVNITNFIAKPTDDCEPGVHQVVLSLSDAETQVEYWSISFTVKVTDFAFDHVSRPFLSKATSAVLGLGSLIMFLLTGLEQVDKTFGLTAGTAAAVLTSTILIRWWSLFQQPKVTHTP